MTRTVLAGMVLAALAVISGCGSESSAGSSTPSPRRVSSPTTTPTPTLSLPPRSCPRSGAAVTVGPLDGEMGRRYVELTMTNCRTGTLAVNGYPQVAVLDEKHHRLKVAVAHGSAYLQKAEPPTKLRLRHGQSVHAMVLWRNYVEMGARTAEGCYLAVAGFATDKPVAWPVYSDARSVQRIELGSTGRIEVTAWAPRQKY